LIDDIQATFRHRFTVTARTRVTNALSAATRNDHAAMALLVRELHSLAGEAGLLGFVEFVPLAREAEDRARAMCSQRTPACAEAAIIAFRELERLIERLEG
jgi:HPt (histidine-containing phosphotransfer) domain-containing protein